MEINETASPDVIVIGAGIVGLAVAEALQHSGQRVLLLEREKVAAGASQGNAGAFAFSDIMPLASPGIIKKALKWFLDPLGPFAVVVKDLPWTMGWLLRFLAASRPSNLAKSIDAQVSLMALSKSSMDTMVARAELTELIRSDGALHLYEGEPDKTSWQLREQHGIRFERLEGDALHRFQPGLDKRFVTGFFVPQWQTVSNPENFCQGIHDRITMLGVQTQYATVQQIDASDFGAEVVLEGGKRISANHIVIAAGPWSSQLAAQLGDEIPLIGERGYNTTFPETAVSLKRMLIFCDHGFVMTPLDGAIRVGGASEVARLDRTPNYKRSEAMVTKAKRFVPDLETSQGKPWMGSRPAIPDTLPVISRSKRTDKVIYAFGHGHLGLTQSAATGQLVSELVNSQQTSIDLTPYRADRF